MPLSTSQEFIRRHIGPTPQDQKVMLSELGFSSLEEMANKVVPKNIRTQKKYSVVGDGISEFELLKKLKAIAEKNQIFKSYIGQGFHDTITPTVIQRNILENPVWYTAYTPYQPEISQGRLEALLNFQTMIMDLTKMEICNASLLDEGTAAAEAMTMAHAIAKNKATDFVVSPDLHQHVIEVIRTRAEPLGLKMHIADPHTWTGTQPIFAMFISYPNTFGKVDDHSALAEKAHNAGALLVVDVDLLAMTLLTPPGEWGADIVVGNSQRFGVPLGFGGPHAAFLATKDAHKRLLPGRLVGVSVDAQGKKALRLTLQTREQHIRREKATSNICTAQVLLANMASMYAVYHGPEGLKNIALRIHTYAKAVADAAAKVGYKVVHNEFFDTVTIETSKTTQICATARQHKINFWQISDTQFAISLNESVSESDLELIGQVLGSPINPNISKEILPAKLQRKSTYMTHPVFNSHHSEPEITRYIHSLQNKDLTLTHSMIPLGSCTMKLNATTELVPVSWPEFNKIHPFAPTEQTRGYAELILDLENKLCDITGFSAVTLAPNSGAQGEYAGLLAIREYHKSKNEGHRNICLIPASAHGTNPASAALAGMEVVVVACDGQGNVEVSDLKAKAQQHAKNLSCLMITYPSTHGVFEESISEICQVVHHHGGQVYMDGANLNALVGMCRPGEYGADVSHMNLHKTFAIPHGGGGPGVGPIGVREHLAKFLPKHVTSAPYGSASILPISWAYITMMGEEGLRQSTLVAILSANYIAKKLDKHYPVLYKGKEGLVAHECILDLRELKKSTGVDVTDVAKRLMDYGFHAPTMSFPVVGTLMVEPTESEPKAELDRFIETMISIRKEIDTNQQILLNSPHTVDMLLKSDWNQKYSREQAAFPLPWVRAHKYWPSVGRIDNAYGDRNVICSCPPIEDYQ